MHEEKKVVTSALSSKDFYFIRLLCVMKIIFYLFIFNIHTFFLSHCRCAFVHYGRSEKLYHSIMFLWMRNISVFENSSRYALSDNKKVKENIKRNNERYARWVRSEIWRKLSPESPNKLYRPSKVFFSFNEWSDDEKEKLFTAMKVKKDIKIRVRIEELFVFYCEIKRDQWTVLAIV